MAKPTIDVHSHVGLDTAFYRAGWWPYATTAQDLIERMDAAGIDKAVCFPFGTPTAFSADSFVEDRSIKLRAGRFPFDEENALLVQEVERIDTDNRLLPFAMFDPSREVASQVESIKKIVGKVAGLKTQTTILKSNIRDLIEPAGDLMRIAEDHNLPVVVHTSVIDNDTWAQAEDCIDVAEAWPNVRFNLAHSLRFDGVSLKRASTVDNVWIDCSAHIIHCRLAQQELPVVAKPERRVKTDYHNPTQVLEDIHAILGDRYMWGSDNPFMSWSDDGMSFISRYVEEVKAIKDAKPQVVEDMLINGPHAWLYGQ